MVKKVFISETNCITPLGFDVAGNVEEILSGISAIRLHDNKALMRTPFYAAMTDDAALNLAFSKISDETHYTRLEKMLILALYPIAKNINTDERTAFILSTTKGNITALQNPTKENIRKAYLHDLAKTIADFFRLKADPIVISNACVSGIMAVSVAKRLVQSEVCDQVLVVAGDEVSEFVLSGFNSFQAMSDLPCKPYSINRNGVTLGEAAAAVLVTSDKNNAKAGIIGDGSINDANHISGPSRTGEGLVRSIESAMREADLEASRIDYISAHGTATLFNDEMEAIALNRLALENVPVNSLKGIYGHTLGASGLLETVIGIESLIQNKLFPSHGFDELGVSKSINIIEKAQIKNMHYFLKTASGFGGCNTAVLFEKVNPIEK